MSRKSQSQFWIVYGISMAPKQIQLPACILVKPTGVLKHGIRWTTHLKRKIKKIRVKLLPSGNLVDMQGNIVLPETLAANPEVSSY